MSRQSQHAATFRALHVPGAPLVLFNVWDAGSAQAVAAAGARAIATGSWSVAAAHGVADGEALPLSQALATLARIVARVDLPVSIDLERGYGDDAEAVARSVLAAVQVGAVGINLEDSVADGSLRATDAQADRIAAARRALDSHVPGCFINARTDVFFAARSHDAHTVTDALDRAHSYARAGADGLFVPGLKDATLIRALVSAAPLPVNVMVGPGTPPLHELAALGVARVSHGPGPYLAAMAQLEQAARAAFAG